MRIATITNWAYGATVALTIAAGITMILASGADRVERDAVQQRDRFDELTAQIENDLSELTDQARLFAVSGDPSHEIVYSRTLQGIGSIEQRVNRLRDLGAGEQELHSLKDALTQAASLEDEQQAAIAAMRKSDADGARRIVFGPEYERELERAHFQMERFRYLLDQRSDLAVEQATVASQRLRSVSEVMVGITAMLFLFVLAFILKRRILKPVVRLSDVVNRLAEQDYEVEPPQFSHVDEIGDMAQAIRIFRENGLERQKLERQRDADWAVRELLARMAQRLQGCESVDDLLDIVRLFAPKIAPELAGRLFVLDASRSMMVCAAEWQGPLGGETSFGPDDCWALRRGQVHIPGSKLTDVPCRHVAAEAVSATICVPLAAQSETIGLLVLQNLVPAHEPDEAMIAYIELMSETIGLALANLNLRQALRAKALFDPLTGLRNRHDLDETLARLAADADTSGTMLGCMMLDIDHFKALNDTFGHDAGDLVIRTVASVFASVQQDQDFVFRYGGEEFLMLMPGFDEAQAVERAVAIRERLGRLKLAYHGQPLGPVTVSMGVALYPVQGGVRNLIASADAALLRAKEEGRDRMVIAADRPVMTGSIASARRAVENS
ncbi:diguanylate cyclase [Novosphingobium sp. BL-8H]|uniref:diguanylate cyclase n=1 Tax=Novosphingobium sp. BL-8H TaxID=3127640 RepID=UPI003758016C